MTDLRLIPTHEITLTIRADPLRAVTISEQLDPLHAAIEAVNLTDGWVTVHARIAPAGDGPTGLLLKIRNAHSREYAAGMPGLYCIECEQMWPCPTWLWTCTGDMPAGSDQPWDPADWDPPVLHHEHLLAIAQGRDCEADCCDPEMAAGQPAEGSQP